MNDVMISDLENRRRHSIRLKGYCYASPGAYFVTIVTHNRMCIFGSAVGGVMRLNVWGEIASAHWGEIPSHYSNVTLDAFVVMPNHVHGILIIRPSLGVVIGVGAQHAAPDDNWGAQHAAPLLAIQHVPPANMLPGSLGAIVRSYKSAVTKHIGMSRTSTEMPVWQRNYYEHIVRNEKDLLRIRDYILDNPLHWDDDRENPEIISPSNPNKEAGS